MQYIWKEQQALAESWMTSMLLLPLEAGIIDEVLAKIYIMC